jgi:uncharacterized protein
MISTLLDSSFIYAAFNRDDPDHLDCLEVIQLPAQKLLMPIITLPEVAFLVQRSKGHWRIPELFRTLRAGSFEWINPEPTDYDRAIEYMEKYRDAELDLVDSILMAMAERLNITRILTLDRRDFSLVRPKHTAAFEILP